MNWDSVQWGSVGEWVGGIGSAAAAATAAWIALADRKSARERHARHVSVRFERSGEPGLATVRVRNDGSLPVVWVSIPVEPVWVDFQREDGKVELILEIGESWAAIEPGQQVEGDCRADHIDVVAFHDVEGRWWFLHAGGRLEEMTERRLRASQLRWRWFEGWFTARRWATTRRRLAAHYR